MPTYYSDKGYLIRLFPTTETSLIVHWLTLENGLLQTIARGARRPKSRLSGQLDLFVQSDLSWAVPTSAASSSSLYYLKEASTLKRHATLAASYSSMLLASYFCHLLDLLLEPNHPTPELYDLLERGLSYLNTHSPTIKALTHFEKQLSYLLGIAPQKSSSTSALFEAIGHIPSMRTQCYRLLK